MLAIPPFWASSKKALLRANTKPPVELVVADLGNKTTRCSPIIGAGGVPEAIEAANIDNQKNTLKNKHLRE